MVMFVTAAARLGLGQLGVGNFSQDVLAAERAAQSGLEYCLTQLRQNPSWRGNANKVTVNLPELVVVESEGNISGLIRDTDGRWSQFLCRFNFQDGPGGGDGFENEPEFRVENPYVSTNNLVSSSPADVFRATGPGYSVVVGSEAHHRIPTWSVSLAVEGRGGCRKVDPSRPQESYPGKSRFLEVVYEVESDAAPVEEASGMAGGDLKVDLGDGSGVLGVNSEVGQPRLRAKGEIKVEGGASTNFLSPNGEVRTPSEKLTASYDSSDVSVAEEQLSDPFYKLEFSEVNKGESGATLSGGTYVWWDDGTLHYYDMTFEQYAEYMKNPLNVGDAGKLVTMPEGTSIVEEGGVKKILITGNLGIVSSEEGVDSFSLIPRTGAAEVPPGDSEGASEGTIGKVAANYFGADQELWLKFLLSKQGGSGTLDFEGPGDDSHIEWDDNKITKWEMGPGVTPQMIMSAIWDPKTMPEGFKWDESEGPKAFDHEAAVKEFSIKVDGGSVIDPPGVSDSLTASSLAVEFAPPIGQSAVISAPGDIRLTGSVTGTGGSIVSGGNIRVTGLGATFAGQDNPVNMYAVGDIFLSTLDENDSSEGDYSFSDLTLSGIVFTQGNFTARLGSDALSADKWGNLKVDGVVVAYGGSPGGSPGVSGGGDINIRAKRADLNYSSAYSGALAGAPPSGFSMVRKSWSNRP